MNLVKPSIERLDVTGDPLKVIETAGRTCYKSEDKIGEGTADKFVNMLLSRGHEAMIEHAHASYRVVCNRGVTHEIVRHRLFSYAQESTRYCNYKGGVSFIIPLWARNLRTGPFLSESLSDFTGEEHLWLRNKIMCESHYLDMLQFGQKPQDARDNLPIATKTEIVITGNLREWRHFFKLRCAKAAHPQMREVANMIHTDLSVLVPVIFDEVGPVV